MGADFLASLLHLFDPARKTKPVVLLGAGASFRSGIPMAAACVSEIAKARFLQEKGIDDLSCPVSPSDWKPLLDRHDWFIAGEDKLAENFPMAVEKLLTPRDFRRRVLQHLLSQKERVNPGYLHLAELVRMGSVSTILTTNFDTLIVEGLRKKQPHISEILEINRTKDDLVRFHKDNTCQVVYLHGSVEYYRDRNEANEIANLDKSLIKSILPLLTDSPVVVVGYRGYEPSIMKHLFGELAKVDVPFKHGIYWCSRDSELHPNVVELEKVAGSNFRLIRIDGFDELFERLEIEVSSSQNKNYPIVKRSSAWTGEVAEGHDLESLDLGLVLDTALEYSKRMGFKLPESNADCIEFLKSRDFLKEDNGQYKPTRGAVMIFGKDPGSAFPRIQTAVELGSKKQQIFSGNLLSQANELMNLLCQQEINPVVRVKGAKTASEHEAYPARGLTELVINFLGHRDYSVDDYNRIKITAGEKIEFQNPGCLSDRLQRILKPDDAGLFSPKRNEKDFRNPDIADIFYGVSKMDKAGSGLPDTFELMSEVGGFAEFRSFDDRFTATIYQAKQESPEQSKVARPRRNQITYQTNLLPLLSIPTRIFRLPLNEKHIGKFDTKFGFSEIEFRNLPCWARLSDCIISFDDLKLHEEVLERIGYVEYVDEQPISWLLDDILIRSKMSWLINSNLNRYLFRFSRDGLCVEPKRKRAYFTLGKVEKRTIRYDSPARKGVVREVVKQRGSFCENEGIHYRIEDLGDDWALQIKPTYIFTNEKGDVPLPPFKQGQKATQRFKFDRNDPVWQDLQFWSTYLADGTSTIDVGDFPFGKLVISSQVCSVEAQEGEFEQ